MNTAISFLRKKNDNSYLSQRELVVSLGKVNFCLKALIEVGLMKVGNFRYSNKKSGYLYLLTPKRIEPKILVTKRFLQAKIKEHESLIKEINTTQQSLEKI